MRRLRFIINTFSLEKIDHTKQIKDGAKIVIKQTVPITAMSPYLHLKLNKAILTINRSLMRTSGKLDMVSFIFFFMLGFDSNFWSQIVERPNKMQKIEVMMDARANFLLASVTTSSSASWWVSSKSKMESWSKSWFTASPETSYTWMMNYQNWNTKFLFLSKFDD